MTLAMCHYHEVEYGEPDPDCPDCIAAKHAQAQREGETTEGYRGDGL